MGGGLPPPTPLALGTSPPKYEPNSSIRTLLIKWVQNLAQIKKSCGAESLFTLAYILHILNLSELVPNFWGPKGRVEAFCTVRPSPLDVQRALCTVKPALLDVQRTLCTSAPRWGANLYTYIGPMALKSSILTTWAAWRRNGSRIVHFGYLGSLAQKCSQWVSNRPFSPTSNKPQEATSNKPQESGVVTRLLPNWLFAPYFENAPPQKLPAE